MRVNGNVNGIKDSYLEILDKLYDIDTMSGQMIDSEILRIISNITTTLNREISIFINRRGKILDVSVGDFASVHLPELTCRRGNRRLSGVRCIHTHPESEGLLSKVDISTLISMRLDCISAVGVINGKICSIYMGYLIPVTGNLAEHYAISGPYSEQTIMDININEVVNKIEKEIISDSTENTNENKKEKVLLVGMCLSSDNEICMDLLEELGQLAETAGAEVAGKIIQKRNKVDTAYYIGSGKAAELGLLRQAYDIDTIIFDDELSGAQVKNLEQVTGANIIDRTTLILDIFAQRAITREGKLQVELAQMKYRLPRLIGFGNVLSRTGGGIGTKGPGEKKLEIDRRRIRQRIDDLEKDLDEVKNNRYIQREKRIKSKIPIISLVGYTNSGKSTLRNVLSRLYPSKSSTLKDKVLEADMLFATLDLTTRLIKLPKGHEILLSDTVGFIRKLPHDLVDAFRATLEEVVYSDMLIHVVDASAPNVKEQIKAVDSVLKQLDVSSKPIITVYNKIDKINKKEDFIILENEIKDVIEISALCENNLDNLATTIENKLFSIIKTVKLKIPYDKMNIKSILYNECNILSEDYTDDSVILKAEADSETILKYDKYIIKV